MYYAHLCMCVCVGKHVLCTFVHMCVCVCVSMHYVHLCMYVLLSLRDDFRNQGNLKSRFHGAVCPLKSSLFTAKSNSRNCNQFRSFDSFYNNNNVSVAKINQNCVVKCL